MRPLFRSTRSGSKGRTGSGGPTSRRSFTATWTVATCTMPTGEGRKAPNTDQDRADLLKSMVAYTGMYRIEGDKWITKVDVSGNPAWVGTEQARFFRFDGDQLQESTPFMQWAARPEKGMVRFVLTWKRAK